MKDQVGSGTVTPATTKMNEEMGYQMWEKFSRLTAQLVKSRDLVSIDILGSSIERCRQDHEQFRGTIIGVFFFPEGYDALKDTPLQVGTSLRYDA